MAIELYSHSLYSDASLLGYWRLEANANDSKGSNNGTSTSITYSAGNGKFGNGAGFDGTNSKIQLVNYNNSSSAVTIFSWVKFSSAVSRATVFYGQYASGNQLWEISSNNSGSDTKLQAIFRGSAGGSTGTALSSTNYGDGNWHFAAATYNNGAITLFVDGTSVATASCNGGTILTSNDNTFIGAGNAGTLKWNGSIDDVAIFTRLLSPTEISDFYNYSASAIKTINGLAKASVKSVNGLAIASVKSYNGLA